MAAPVEARTFGRAEARAWLVDEIRMRASADVAVLRNEPREITDLAIWLGDTTGQITYPVVGRCLPRHDTFTTVVMCEAVWPGDEAAEAEQRCEQLAAVVMDAVSGDPHAPLEVCGLIDITVTAVDGPNPVMAGEGYAAVMTVAVQFDMRITR